MACCGSRGEVEVRANKIERSSHIFPPCQLCKSLHTLTSLSPFAGAPTQSGFLSIALDLTWKGPDHPIRALRTKPKYLNWFPRSSAANPLVDAEFYNFSYLHCACFEKKCVVRTRVCRKPILAVHE